MPVRLVVAAVGRMKAGPEQALLERYSTRVSASGRGLGWGPLEIIDIPEGRAGDPVARRNDEARRLIAKVDGCDGLIVLDEKGRQYDSASFAADLKRRRAAGTRALAFLIGGPDGHGETVLGIAHTTLSLGAMTLPHMLARIILVEQLYRAVTILAGHPYHRF
jgi:23S rRNA (pseudouridine1915-N3)-methyltransferase